MNNTYPEYQTKSRYEGARIVEELIIKECESRGIKRPNFSVKITGESYSPVRFTRVYSGDWQTKKEWISSKNGERIDMEKVMEFLARKAKEQKSADDRYNAKREAEKLSGAIASKINEDMGLTFGSPISVYSSDHSADKVQVVFKKDMTEAEAVAVVKAIQSVLNN